MEGNPIYKFLKDNNLTQKDEASFVKEYSDPSKAAELHAFMVKNDLTKKDKDSFYQEYFSSEGKAAPVGSGKPSGVQGAPSPTPSEKPQTIFPFDVATEEVKQDPLAKIKSLLQPSSAPQGEIKGNALLESIERQKAAPAKAKKPPIEEIETTAIAESTAGPKLRIPSFVKTEKPIEEFLQQTPAYISTQQDEIKSIQQNFGKRTEGKDLDRLASKIKTGEPSIIEKDQLNQSFVDLEDDYLDYLKATDPELGEYRQNEITALRAKEKANNLNDAEKKRLLAFRNEAIDTKNLALEGKIWEIKEQTDIATFQRDSAPIMVQLGDLKTKFNQLKLDPNGNNPPSKVAEAQKIVQDQERLLGQLNQLREKTGFTEDKEKEYSDSIRSYVGNTAIKEVGVQKRFPDLAKAEKERALKSAQRYREAQEGGVIQGLVGFTEDMVNTVGRLATNVFKAPKVLGDALGDNDYDDWDALYTNMTSLQEDREAIFGAPRALSFGEAPKYEDLPLSYRLARLGGGGIGSIAAFGFGGEFSAALGLPEFAGITGTAFITGQSDFYDEAIAAGMNPKDAARAGVAINTVVAPMEAIMGDVKFFRTPEGKSFIKSFVKGFLEGGFKQGIKQAWKSLPESAASYLKPAFQEGVIEEGGAQVAEDVAKEIINIDSSVKYLGLWDKKDYENAVLGGSIASGVLRALNRPKAYSASPEQEAVLGAAIDDSENITNTFTSDAFTATNTNLDVAIIQEAKEIKEGIEGSPSFNELPKPAQDHIVAELLRKKKLEESMKKSGIKTQDTIDEIARIDSNVQETLNNAKQIKEQYDTQNIEGVPSPVGEREGAVEAQPVEGRGAEEAPSSGVLQAQEEIAPTAENIEKKAKEGVSVDEEGMQWGFNNSFQDIANSMSDEQRNAYNDVVFDKEEKTMYEFVADEYAKSKAENTNPEFVAAVDKLLGAKEPIATLEEEAASETEFAQAVDGVKEIAPDLNEADADFAASLVQQGATTEEAVDYVQSTPEAEREAPSQVVEEMVPDALKDVESTANALEGTDINKNILKETEVSDNNGEPIKVYHGTNVDFDEFQKTKSTRTILMSPHNVETSAFFFHPKKEFAEGFGKKIKEVYLNIKKLANNHQKELIDAVKETWGKKGSVETANNGNVYFDDYTNDSWITKLADKDGIDWMLLENDGFIENLKKRGIDGTGVWEDDNSISYAVFDAKNIIQDKSNKQISESYHKAKADGSNPELVKAVEDLLGKKEKVSEPTQEDIADTAKKTGVSPKNLRDLYNINRDLFGLNRVKSFASAIAMDRMVGAMAKRAGLTKEQMYGKLEFRKDTEENVLKADNALFQGTIDGKPTTLRNIDVDVVNGFYSPLEKIISETKQEKMPAKQWLDKFAKGEEAKWTGLQDWLSQQEGSVSKQDILNYLKDNRISVVEVVKGANEIPFDESKFSYTVEKEGGLNWYKGFYDGEEVGEWNIPVHEDNPVEKVKQYVKEKVNEDLQKDPDNTRFSPHQLEGEKENYKEVLVTLPNVEYDYKKEEERRFIKNKYDSHIKEGDSHETALKTIKRYVLQDKSIEEIDAIIKSKPQEETQPFQSTHFDEPNILVHLRMNTRTDADGNKVLFLEEVQSDWGQTGKKEGFAISKEELASIDKQIEENRKKRVALNEEQYKIGPENKRYWEIDDEVKKLTKEADALIDKWSKGSQGKPTAPFVMDTNAWTKLGLKVALKEAVAQGADKIAWTTGTQQFDRWGTEKIDWVKTNKGWTVNIQEQFKGTAFEGMNIDEKALSESGTTIASKEDLKAAIDRTLSREKNEAERQKLTDRIWDRMQKEDSGTSLPRKEGMESFYGTEGTKGIVGGVAEKLFGQKVGEVNLDTKTKSKQGFKIEDKYISTPTQVVMYEKTHDFYLNGKGEKVTKIQALELIKNPENYIEGRRKKSTQPSIDITPALRAEVERGLALFQRQQGQQAKGAMVAADGRFIIYAITDPNVSTPLHELAHVFEHYLTDDERAIVQNWAKTKAWTTQTSEAFAKGFEKYLAEGKASTTALQKVFDKFKTWLFDIYKGIAGSDIDIKLNDKMRNIYASMLDSDKVFGKETGLTKEVEGLLGKKEKVSEPISEKPAATKPKTLKERAAEARAKAEQLRAATGGTAMVAPKLYAAALDAYAAILETADNIADALKQWRQTKEYKDLNEADKKEIENEIKGDLGAEYVAAEQEEDVFADIDKALSLKGPESAAARKEFREKYGKEMYDRAIEITRNFDKIVEQLENQGKLKKKCP